MSDEFVGSGDHQAVAILNFAHGEGVDLYHQQVQKTCEPGLSL